MAFRGCFGALSALYLSSVSTAMAAEEVVGHAKPWQLNFQPAVTPVMERLTGLHNYLEIIAIAVAVFVLMLMIYVCVKFNKKANPVPSKTTHNTVIEIIWTVLPILILVSVAIPSLRLHYFMGEVEAPEMTLKVTGYQWYWGYAYPDQALEEYQVNMKTEEELKGDDLRLLSTDRPVVVPINTTVRVQLTGSDVIHAWAIPAFGVKQDAVPGRLNETWFKVTKPGVYYGQCSELCGVKHGFMPIEVHAVEKPVFDKWVERAKTGNYEIADLVNAGGAAVDAVPAPVKVEDTSADKVDAQPAAGEKSKK